jgi:hypothetical protein
MGALQEETRFPESPHFFLALYFTDNRVALVHTNKSRYCRSMAAQPCVPARFGPLERDFAHAFAPHTAGACETQ